jgi:hypothetical protein
MNFEELRKFYSEHFSLGYLNPISENGHSSFERRLILISLICYLYSKNKPKNPDLTYYSLVYKLSDKLGLSDDFIKGLAIVCEDFAYNCSDGFPTFGLSGKDILKEIRGILSTYIPF